MHILSAALTGTQLDLPPPRLASSLSLFARAMVPGNGLRGTEGKRSFQSSLAQLPPVSLLVQFVVSLAHDW